MIEKDPNGLDLKTPGAKADDGKPEVLRGVLQYFPRAVLEVAKVSRRGADKYSWKGWERVPDGIQRYGDACARHLLAESIEGPIDRDTSLLHAAQVAWNALARLELILRDMEKVRIKVDLIKETQGCLKDAKLDTKLFESFKKD